MGTLYVWVCGKELSECMSVLWINVILRSWIVVYDHTTVKIHVWKPRTRKRVENVTSSADECGWSCLGTSDYVKYFSTFMDGSRRPLQILSDVCASKGQLSRYFYPEVASLKRGGSLKLWSCSLTWGTYGLDKRTVNWKENQPELANGWWLLTRVDTGATTVQNSLWRPFRA